MNEIWKPIEGFSKYKVSNIGNVMNVKNNLIRKPTFDKDGYCKLNLMSDNNEMTSIRVHQIVCKSFIGNAIDNKIVNHKNGIKNDNRIENLEYVSFRENTCHFMKGKYMRYVSIKGKKFRSTLRHNGNLLNFGVFNTELEAHNVAVKYLADNNIQNKYI